MARRAATLARADATALDTITNALLNSKEGSVAAGKDLADFDLGADPDAPGGARRLVTFEVAGETRGLRVGRATPVGGHRYVARLADEAIAYVESFRVNAFERNLADLRDRDVFTFASDDVERITIAGPDGASIVLGREAGDWQILGPSRRARTGRPFGARLSLALRARNFVDAPEVIGQPLRDSDLRLMATREKRPIGRLGSQARWKEGDSSRPGGEVGAHRRGAAPGFSGGGRALPLQAARRFRSRVRQARGAPLPRGERRFVGVLDVVAELGRSAGPASRSIRTG